MKTKTALSDLLHNDQLAEADAKKLLSPAIFDDWQFAVQSLQRIAKDPSIKSIFEKLLPNFLAALADSAKPDRALLNFENFCDHHQDSHGMLRYLADEPHAAEILMTLFAGSQFLSEILVRHPAYFDTLKDRKRLTQPKSREQIYTEALLDIEPIDAAAEKLNMLRRYQRRELLRIGTGDLFGLINFKSVTRQLSHLAEVCVRVCLRVTAEEVSISADGFTVLAMGKLGGQELNYSSDIDLLFIAKTNDHNYQRLGQRLITALTQATAEGFLYRVDMRLRPWGSTGRLVPSLEENISYIHNNAKLWEKQAFIKARWIAGDEALGTLFFQDIRPFIYAHPLADPADASSTAKTVLRGEVHSMKQKIEEKLQQKGQKWGEVKSGEGSIRDIEFVTQFLQLLNGASHPEIRSHNTLNALARLTACGILPMEQYSILSEGYTFLRAIEHHLQMMYYQQTHLLPEEARELSYLAHRMGFDGKDLGLQLVNRYQQHRQAIRQIYMQYLGESSLKKASAASAAAATDYPESKQSHLKRMQSDYAETFTPQDIQQHAEMADRLSGDALVEVDTVLLADNKWQVTIVAFDYPGELSIICGLLLIYRFNILDGQAFTYQPLQEESAPGSPAPRRRFTKNRRYLRSRKPKVDTRRKIVDVFTVEHFGGEPAEDVWRRYKEHLTLLLQLSRNKKQSEAHGEVAKQVAIVLKNIASQTDTLLPVEIEIDNNASEEYTVLRIDARDTAGFLYEFVNALTLNGIYIARVIVNSIGNRVHDTFFVTNISGEKIITPQKQRQLRLAAALVKHFTHLLPRSPNPESAMLHFRELVSQLFNRAHWYQELASLQRPEILSALAKLLGISDFLWDDFLRMQHTNLFPIISDLETLSIAKTKDELHAELEKSLQTAKDEDARRKALNAFKDREMFRIDMRFIQGMIFEFQQFSDELSDLAEVVLEKAYHFSFDELHAQYGEPQLPDGSPCRMAICALGKFGGREIGFASDIELIFVYEDKGKTAGAQQIGNAEFYDKLTNKLKGYIQAKQAGIFEIDLRLRPYGKASNKAMLLDTFRNYFSTEGAAWNYERQAMVKLRPIAGDAAFGQMVISARDNLLYQNDAFDVAAMRAIRERQVRQLVGGGTVNAKFSPGALVDLEYLVQALQIQHGRDDRELRTTNTAQTMQKLLEKKILPQKDYQRLSEAHLFLRRLIEAQRMVRGNAKDLTVPPEDSEEFAFLSRRLGYADDAGQLQQDLIHHTAAVREISDKLLVA